MTSSSDPTRSIAFYREYYSLALTVAQQRLRGAGDAEAVAAEAFRVAWAYHHLEGQQLSLPWLYQVVWKLIGNEYRRLARADAFIHAVTPLIEEHADELANDDVREVRRCIRLLPEETRELLYMAYWEGLSRGRSPRSWAVPRRTYGCVSCARGAGWRGCLPPRGRRGLRRWRRVMDDVERRIRAARPVSGHRDLPLSDRAKRELAELLVTTTLHEERKRATPGPSSRRRLLLAAVIVVAIIGLVPSATLLMSTRTWLRRPRCLPPRRLQAPLRSC